MARNERSPSSRSLRASRCRIGSLLLAVSLALSGCASALGEGQEPAWPVAAKKWFDRAHQSFDTLDIGDAEYAIKNAQQLEPQRESVRLLAANISLSQLRFDEAVAELAGLNSAAARGLRARAFWYSGQLSKAADELDRLLEDPDVKDQWAQGVVQLARTGEGREPFRVTGDLLAVVEMPRIPLPTLIVPVELNGEPVLAMVATGSPEVVIDTTQHKPSWVSLRFARSFEVKDVPALPRDLSSLSRRIGAPIRLLLGANLLRRLNVTFDFYANQFVVRSFVPPTPPGATAIDVSYIKGGGMVMRSHLGTEPTAPGVSLLVDTSVLFPLALADSGWQKAGIDPHAFPPVPGENNLRQGTLPRLTIGSFDVPRVPAMYGFPFEDLEQAGGIHLDGVIGASLVSEFRASLADQGRTLWLEEMPAPLEEAPAADAGSGAPAAAATPPAPAARTNSKPSSGPSVSAKPAAAKAP